jgi:hypothetical protein
MAIGLSAIAIGLGEMRPHLSWRAIGSIERARGLAGSTVYCISPRFGLACTDSGPIETRTGLPAIRIY